MSLFRIISMLLLAVLAGGAAAEQLPGPWDQLVPQIRPGMKRSAVETLLPQDKRFMMDGSFKRQIDYCKLGASLSLLLKVVYYHENRTGTGEVNSEKRERSLHSPDDVVMWTKIERPQAPSRTPDPAK